jgi:NitT/TauT family transport system permease protein
VTRRPLDHPDSADPGAADVHARARPARRRRTAFSSERVLDVLYPFATVALLLLAWELWVRLGHEPRYIMVPFSEVAKACFRNAGVLLHHTWVTVKECLLGWALGTAIAIPMAFAIVSLPLVSRTVYPLIVAYHVIPVIAIGPLLSVWFGFGILPKLLIVANFTFFPILLNTASGLRATLPDQIHLFRSAGATPTQTFTRLRFPNALPQFFVGMKIASTLALIGAVVAEFISASSGLGYYVLVANGNLDTRDLMVGVVYLALAGGLLFGGVVLVEKLVLPWHVSQRSRSPGW